MKTATRFAAEADASHTTIRTTLYDLIEAIHTEVGPEDDDLVVTTVMHLMATGRMKFPQEQGYCN